MKAPFVIAISGTSGVGKSTLIHYLLKQVEQATGLGMDDYEETSTYPTSINAWIENGANPSDFATPHLAENLQRLRQGKPVIDPMTNEEYPARPIIILEEPFGRERDAMHQMIDYVVYLKIPYDLALARKIQRKITDALSDHEFEQGMRHISTFINWYRQAGYLFYQTVNDRVEANCDLVVDATQPTEDIAAPLLEIIKRHI
jgi:uridine kinase